MEENPILSSIADPEAMWSLARRVGTWFVVAFLAHLFFGLDGGAALIAVFAADILVLSPIRYIVARGNIDRVEELEAAKEGLEAHLHGFAQAVEIGNHNAQLAEERKATLMQMRADALAANANFSELKAAFDALKLEKEKNEGIFLEWRARAKEAIDKQNEEVRELKACYAGKSDEAARLSAQCERMKGEIDSLTSERNSQAQKMQSHLQEVGLLSAQLDSQKNAYEPLLAENIALKAREADLVAQCDLYKENWRTAAAKLGAAARWAKKVETLNE
jgi:chromosome segregation ATPase